ncbi:polyketide synthase docking domain-containing protein [Streptomyces sp. NBC_00316]|nr:polyketide synthase docking domain-containing protein [Streptomyces sp. NBC_00316]
MTGERSARRARAALSPEGKTMNEERVQEYLKRATADLQRTRQKLTE